MLRKHPAIDTPRVWLLLFYATGIPVSLRRRESKWKCLKNFMAGAKVIWAALWGMSCWIVDCQSQFPEDKASLHVNYSCSFSSRAGLTTSFSFLELLSRAPSISKSLSALRRLLTGDWVQNSLTSFYPSYQAEAAWGWVIGSQDSQAQWIQSISDELKRPVLLEWKREHCSLHFAQEESEAERSFLFPFTRTSKNSLYGAEALGHSQ